MSNIKFDNPWLLFLIIPFVGLVIAGFFIVPKQKRFRPKNIISLAIHMVLAVTLSFSFSNMQFLTSSQEVELYLVADCSDSQKTNVEQIAKTVNQIRSEADNTTKVGLVAFAKDFKVLYKAGSNLNDSDVTKSLNSVFETEDFNRSATDLQGALEYTDSLFNKTAIKRMVLVTDGIETDNSALSAVETLLANNVSLDVVGLDQKTGDEVAITGLEYTDHCFLNRKENVKVMIRSKKGAPATLTLTSNGEIVSTQSLTLSKGLNIATFALDSSTLGTKDYQVSVNCTKDSFKENNERSFSQDYTDDFSVLFIGSSSDELTNLKNLNSFSQKTKIDSYIDRSDVPYLLSDLVKYDEIVVSNTNLTELDNSEEFINNLYTAVNDYGKTLMTFGSTFSGQSASGSSAKYNDLLPIQNQSDGAKALVLVIDRSGSMQTDSRLSKAKNGAIKVLDVLNENDMVSIVSFSDTVKVHQAMTSVKNKDQIIEAISKIKVDGGTVLSSGLKEAQKQLRGLDVEYKNIIALTDGSTASGDEKKCLRLVSDMADENICSSFINITNSSGASFLKKCANKGNGSYYYCRTAASLENIILTSVSNDMANKPVVGDNDTPSFAVQINDVNDATISGISSLEPVTGYIFSHMKPDANTVLTVQYKKTITDESGNSNVVVSTAPLFAYWTYGKGTVASFTSNIGGDYAEWTQDFRAEQSGKTFLQNMVTQCLPSRSATSPIDITYTNNGFSSAVSVLSSDNNPEARAHIKVVDPNGKSIGEYDFYFDGKYYSGTIALSMDDQGKVISGKYTLDVHYQTQDSSKAFNTSLPLFFDCSKEYDSFSNDGDAAMMYRLAKLANGTYSNSSDYHYKATSSEVVQKSYHSTMTFFLITSVVLYLIDIFIRKSENISFKKKAKAA